MIEESKPILYVSHTGAIHWGTEKWLMHREGDKPAVIDAGGTLQYYYEGEIHRENDRPAEINADGGLTWYFHDRAHREYGKPAVISPDGIKRYFNHGKEYHYLEEK